MRQLTIENQLISEAERARLVPRFDYVTGANFYVLTNIHGDYIIFASQSDADLFSNFMSGRSFDEYRRHTYEMMGRLVTFGNLSVVSGDSGDFMIVFDNSNRKMNLIRRPQGVSNGDIIALLMRTFEGYEEHALKQQSKNVKMRKNCFFILDKMLGIHV